MRIAPTIELKDEHKSELTKLVRSTRAIGVHFPAGAVQRHGFDLDVHDLLALKLFEHLVQHPGLGPLAHARVHCVPIAQALGQTAPLAAPLQES